MKSVSLSVAIKWLGWVSGSGKEAESGGDLVGFMEGATRVRNRKALVGVGKVEESLVVEEGTHGHM